MDNFLVDLSCASLNYDLNATSTSLEALRKERDEHLAMITNLRTIAAEIKYKMMVPIGTRALMPGWMVHTNELLVSLGDGWFVKRSAAQTVDILKRRVDRFDEAINSFNEQFRLISDRLECLHVTDFGLDKDGGQQLVDICEPYDPDREREWRERHRDSVRHEKLNEMATRKN